MERASEALHPRAFFSPAAFRKLQPSGALWLEEEAQGTCNLECGLPHVALWVLVYAAPVCNVSVQLGHMWKVQGSGSIYVDSNYIYRKH